LYGAKTKDGKLIYDASKKIGFLSGEENKEMKEAHVNSVLVTGEPFQQKEPFDFGNQDITKRIYAMMPVMLKNRLRPPPPEVYSLHRVLSAAYLTAMKMKAKVPVSKIFDDVYNKSIQDLKSF
jgi:aarF domain-containing kinase